MALLNATADHAAAAAPPVAARGALASLALCMLLPALATSIANAGLPALQQGLNARFAQVQWIVLAYLLTMTAVIVSVGRLGDLLGRRRLLLVGIMLFTFASMLCGVATTVWSLIAARALQGLGAAIMTALAMALIGAAVPRTDTGRAMGVLGSLSALGTALGPSLGGVLTAAGGWRLIFLVNLPLGLLALLLVLRQLPADEGRIASQGIGFDARGAGLLMLALATGAAAMTAGSSGGTQNLVLLAVAMASALLFGRRQARTATPLIPPALLREPGVGAGLVMGLLVSTVMMATLVVGPFVLSRGLELDGLRIGLVLSAGPLAAALAGVPAGRLVDHLGAARVGIAGLCGIAAGLCALCTLAAAWGSAGYVGCMVIVTLGYALFQAANNTAVMTAVQAGQRGLMAGLLNLSRNLGLICGAAAMGSVFRWAVSEPDLASASAPAVLTGMRITFAVAAVLIVVAIGIARRSAIRADRHAG